MSRFLLIPFLTLSFFFVASAASASEQSYIVVFKDNVSLKSEVADIKEESNVPRVFSSALKGAQVILSTQEKDSLAKDPAVSYIEKDAPVSTLRETALWGLDRIDQRLLPNDGRFEVGQTGAGVKAYIVDTGIRSDHTEFSGRVLPGYSSISDGRGTEDCDGHGTHVSGTVAGSTYGVAPAAKLVPVRTLDCQGSGTWSGVIAGIDWIVSDHKAGEKAVANMSIGGTKSTAVNDAVARLVADGVPAAVAAGNENSDACYFSPASAPGAITVGATTSADTKASYSNYGSCLDIFAPGTGILSAYRGSATDSATLSGTSMASPHVAGGIALMLESNRTESNLISQATVGRLLGISGSTQNRLLYLGEESQPPAPTPPANDNFASAASLEIGASSGSNTLATKETGEPDHVWSYSMGRTSVWYKWTAPASGRLVLDTDGSNFDTLLAVYRGSALSSLTPVISNDDAIGRTTSRVSFSVQSGETYRVAVDGYYGASGDVSLSATFSYISSPVYITSTPNNPSSSKGAAFSFAGGSGSFECSLDESAWQTCSSPASYASLSEGWHSFRVRSFGADAVFYNWRVDTIAPAAAVITSAPAESTENKAASFSFTGEAGASFICSLDGSTPSICTSPTSYTVSVGGHSFTVWQKDAAGNQSEPVTYNWSVRETAILKPAPPTIQSGPPGFGYFSDASFSFAGDPGASFQCSIDNSEWTPCASPAYYPYLAPGNHLFAVRQILNGVASDPSYYSWQTDALRAPVITRGPASITTNRQARFFFVGQGSFLCRLDDRPWSNCSSPRTYNNLSFSRHVFRVRSVVDGISSPIATYSWRVQEPRRTELKKSRS